MRVFEEDRDGMPEDDVKAKVADCDGCVVVENHITTRTAKPIIIFFDICSGFSGLPQSTIVIQSTKLLKSGYDSLFFENNLVDVWTLVNVRKSLI